MLRKMLSATVVAILAAAIWSTDCFGQIGGQKFPRGLCFGGGYLNNLESIRMDYKGAGTQYLSGNFGGYYLEAWYTASPSEEWSPSTVFIDISLCYKQLQGDLHTRRVKESYLALPVRFSWRIPAFEKWLYFSPYAGPTFQYGLSSKADDYDFYHPDGRLKSKRFNVLIGAGLSFTLFRHYRLDIGYDIGLPRYTRKTDTERISWNTSGFHTGLAWQF